MKKENRPPENHPRNAWKPLGKQPWHTKTNRTEQIQTQETNRKAALVLLIFTIIIALGWILLSVFKAITDSKPEVGMEKGSITIAESEKDTMPLQPDAEWEKADNEYYEGRENLIPIVDDEEQLSQENFLPLKAHFLKSEAIGGFLKEKGLTCEQVYVVPDSAVKDGNNASFLLAMDEYPNLEISVTYYTLTEEFQFEIISLID